MSTPVDILLDIQERTARMNTPDGINSPPDRYLTFEDRAAGDRCIEHIVRDLTRLVSAATGVLERHRPRQRAGFAARCEACNHAWPCPDYRNLTDALNQP